MGKERGRKSHQAFSFQAFSSLKFLIITFLAILFYLRNGKNMRKTESIGQEDSWLNWLPKIRSSINLPKA